MKLAHRPEPSPPESEDAELIYAGDIPVSQRKPGSGRPRIIEEDSEVFNIVLDYAESAGIGQAADSRRRNDIGRFGFTIPELRRQVQEKLFQDDPEKAPSETTLRRLFEAPSKSANSCNRYRGDIRARPGTHQNDAAAGEGRHPHQHQCFTMVRLIR